MRKTDLPDGKCPESETTTHTSFDRCLVDGDSAVASRGRHSRRRAFGLSFVIETGLLAIVILSPLITTVAQPHLARSTYIPFALGRPMRAKPDSKPQPPNRGFHAPDWNFTLLSAAKPMRPADDPGESGPAVEDIGAGPIGDTLDPAISGFSLALQPSVPPVEAIRKSDAKQPLKLSEGVVEAQLISRVEPRYPILAVETRMQGTVRLQAIISRDGRITSLVVLSGHPLLVQAALDAVRQWRYRPTMLDGGPVEVETTITVVFQLHN